MPDAAPIAATVQGCAVDYQTNVLLPVSNVRNEYPVLTRHIAALPENDLIAVAGQEVFTGFIASQVVQLYAEHMPVIENHKAPAIAGIKAAGAINPRNANHPVNKFIFIHAFNR